MNGVFTQSGAAKQLLLNALVQECEVNGQPSFQAGPLGRVGALDETAVVELAHNAIVDDVFYFQLADLRITRF